MKLEYRMCTS